MVPCSQIFHHMGLLSTWYMAQSSWNVYYQQSSQAPLLAVMITNNRRWSRIMDVKRKLTALISSFIFHTLAVFLLLKISFLTSRNAIVFFDTVAIHEIESNNKKNPVWRHSVEGKDCLKIWGGQWKCCFLSKYEIEISNIPNFLTNIYPFIARHCYTPGDLRSDMKFRFMSKFISGWKFENLDLCRPICHQKDQRWYFQKYFLLQL